MELPKLGNTKNPIGAECNGSPSGEKSLETKPTMQRILVGNQGDQYVEKEHVHEKTNIRIPLRHVAYTSVNRTCLEGTMA